MTSSLFCWQDQEIQCNLESHGILLAGSCEDNQIESLSAASDWLCKELETQAMYKATSKFLLS